MLMNTALSKSVESDREHIVIKPSVLYVGTPVVLVTSLNPDGTTNISPMSSAWTLFDRVVLGLTSTSKGRENAMRERQLVLNFPSPDLWQKIEARRVGILPYRIDSVLLGGKHSAPDNDGEQ